MLSLLSIVLMVMDYHQFHIKPVRTALTWVTTPVTYLVNWPSKTYHLLQSSIASQDSLLRDNQRLNAEVISLQLKLQKLVSIEQENQRLRALLSSSKYVQTKVKVGQIVSVATNPSVQEMTINIGEHEQIYSGQPVVDAFGVFGQIIQVSPKLSRVLLLTDSRSAIPVENSRSSFRAIAEGRGAQSSLLHLTNVPKTADIKVGDMFITSGLGGAYPEGYPVGEVTSIKDQPGSHFATITLEPAAHLHQSRLLLLLWPNQETLKQGS